jgi:hypothetical protein
MIYILLNHVMYIYADTILTNLIYTNTIRMSLTGTRYFP